MAVESKFTPHARGSTFPLVVILNPFVVYPACAGIDPLIGCGGSTKTSLPRMRGDRPFAEWMAKGKAEFTPHADRPQKPSLGSLWTWFTRMADRPYMPQLYTIAIVFYPACGSTRSIHNPEPTRLVYPACGSTVFRLRSGRRYLVYPACGIDPEYGKYLSWLTVYRMRDRPIFRKSNVYLLLFTRMRGSTVRAF